MLAYQRLTAPNDPMGNPQRVWLLYRIDGLTATVVRVEDEGYRGNPFRDLDAAALPTLSVSVQEYRSVLDRYATPTEGES